MPSLTLHGALNVHQLGDALTTDLNMAPTPSSYAVNHGPISMGVDTTGRERWFPTMISLATRSNTSSTHKIVNTIT